MARPKDPNTKIDLLRAAESVFVAHGLERAHVEDITQKAGCSKGAFYLHFQSKEDAFSHLAESLMARLVSHLMGVEDPRQIPPAGRPAWLQRRFEHDVEVFEFLWQNRAFVRLMLSGAGSMRFGYLVDGFAERTRVQLEEVLAWGQACGLYRADADVKLGALALAGAYDGLAREVVRQEKHPDVRRWLWELNRMVARALGSPDLIEMTDQLVNNSGPSHGPATRHAALG